MVNFLEEVPRFITESQAKFHYLRVKSRVTLIVPLGFPEVYKDSNTSYLVRRVNHNLYFALFLRIKSETRTVVEGQTILSQFSVPRSRVKPKVINKLQLV